MTTEDAQMVPAPLGPVQRMVRPGAEALSLVERLRTRPTGDPYLHMMVHEAADEIERLQSSLLTASRQLGEWEEAMGKTVDERDRMRAALQAVVDADAADTLGIEAALLKTVKAALKA